MGFATAIEHIFANYANFKGRARRSEYWYFILFYWLVLLGLTILMLLAPVMGVLLGLFMLGTAIPGADVCWRRLHDVGRSGLWWLLSLVPLVGTVVLVIWLAQAGQPGPNQFGPDPKGARPGQYRHQLRDQGRGSLAIRCLSGPMQGQTFPVGLAGVHFGRETGCQVRFPDGAPGVSRRHCCLRWEQGSPVLVDLGSTYGTFLADGRQLPPNYPTPVAAGTRFYLANTGNLFQLTVF